VRASGGTARPAAALAALVAALVAPACRGPAAERPPLLVAAAVSLTEALAEIGRLYERRSGERVDFTFASSSALARQLARGAPADVFVSADEVQMDYAASLGAIDPATRTPVAGNTLVLVAPRRPAGPGGPRPWSSPRRLLEPDVRRVAVGDPAAVPAGRYARAYLEREGLWRALEPKLVPSASVRAALAAVARGAADAAIVYASDAAVESGVEVVLRLPPKRAPRVVYVAAVTRRARDPARAARFVRFLVEEEAQQVLARHGLLPVR
jgi:molybdate transport system substrate-binding protein